MSSKTSSTRATIPALLTGALALGAVLVPSAAHAAPGDPVNIPDSALRSCFNAMLDQSDGDEVTEAQAASLRSFNCNGHAVADLTGVESLTGATSIAIDNINATDITSFTDLSPLAGLADLEWLRIESPNLADLSPLAGLTNLASLSVAGGANKVTVDDTHDSAPVTDLSPLAGLTNLNFLDVADTHATDLTPLGGLSLLRTLSVSSDATDLSPLTGIPLTDLSIYRGDGEIGALTDLSPLADIISLERLSVYGTHVSDLSAVSGLTNLWSLQVSESQVADLSPLSEMRQLIGLYLSNNLISDVSPLSDLTGLEMLSLDFNRITDGSPLAALADKMVDKYPGAQSPRLTWQDAGVVAEVEPGGSFAVPVVKDGRGNIVTVRPAAGSPIESFDSTTGHGVLSEDAVPGESIEFEWNQGEYTDFTRVYGKFTVNVTGETTDPEGNGEVVEPVDPEVTDPEGGGDITDPTNPETTNPDGTKNPVADSGKDGALALTGGSDFRLAGAVALLLAMAGGAMALVTRRTAKD